MGQIFDFVNVTLELIEVYQKYKRNFNYDITKNEAAAILIQCSRARTPIVEKLTQPSILPRSVKGVAVLLMHNANYSALRVCKLPAIRRRKKRYEKK